MDNNATTKLEPKVLEGMMPYLTNLYANAASRHIFGLDINDAVKIARSNVADLINSENNEIIFTSGSTEAINLAIKGIAETYNQKGKHIITVTTEHSAVIDTYKYLEQTGFDVTFLPVQSDGLVDLEVLKNIIRKDTILVSIMFANNETGVLQPIKEIAEISHSSGAFFMTDATQAFGKITINVRELGVDLMTFSGHKIYGPKGIGGLYIRSRGKNKPKLNAQTHGGGHERNFRSGTLNVPGIVGLGIASEIAKQEMKNDSTRIKLLRDYLENELLKIEDSFLNGNKENRLYNTSNICFRGANSEVIIMGLKNIIVSNGSACTSTSIYPSHVLTAMGLSEKEAFSSIRFSLGKFNTKKEIDQAIKKVQEVVSNLREMSKV